MRRRDRGSVLVVAMVVLVAITFIALTLAREARIEVQVAARATDDVRTRALADSCIEKMISMLKNDDTVADTLQDLWRDDEADLRNFQLGAGHCWIVFGEEDPGDGREIKYGVRDEASKLNVNTATLDQLLQIPGMTEDIAESILDWRDQDDNPMPNGAESSYYNALTPGYNAKNGPFESMEELLRVKGIDESVLYGEDRNRNGFLDPCEDDGAHSFPPDDQDGALLRGFADYLTVYSLDMNWTKDGRARLNIASAPRGGDAIKTRLTTQGMDSTLAQRVQDYVEQRRGPPITSIGDLVNVQGMDETGFAIAADELTLTDAAQVPGKINVNTAAKEVLAGLPGLTTDDVSAIMSRRLNAGDDLSSPAWLLRVLTKQKVQRVFDLVTTRSYQFTVHAAVCLDDPDDIRPMRRIDAVIDRSYSPVRIVWRRDLTQLGFPIPNERGAKLP